MIDWARLLIVLLGQAIALMVITAGGLTCDVALQAWHFRHQPPLHEQDPPGWLAALARVILIMVLAAFGFAALLHCGAGAC